MFSKKHIIKCLLLVFTVETLCATYGLKIGDHSAVVSVIYFIAGVSMSLLIISIPPPEKNRFSPLIPNKFNRYFRVMVFLIMSVMAFIVARYWFDLIPIDIDFADMLPIIKVMNERFVAGEWRHVYDNIPEIW